MSTAVTLDGQPLTDVDAYGCEWYTFAPITGWSGSPSSTIQIEQNPRGHGGFVSSGLYLTPRVITLNGVVVAPDEAGLAAARDRLYSAAAVDRAVKLQLTEGDLSRYCSVYRQDVVLAEADTSTDVMTPWSVQLVAPDPRKFGDDLATSTRLPEAIGGFTVPFTVPFTIASTVSAGVCSLTNPGTQRGPVQLRIEPVDGGTLTGPMVTHVGTGLTLVFASSMTLNPGEWLDVDMENRLVLANGQASRAGWVTQPGFSGFEPGPNTWAFAAASGTGLLTVTGTPAWT